MIAPRHAGPLLQAAERPHQRIMVVDDYPAIQAIIVRLLSKEGYSVTAPASAADALQMIIAGPEPAVDLLLTDLDMPGMDGDELVRRARNHDPALPVVVMASPPDHLIVNHQMDWSAVGLLEKPFLPTELLSAIRTAQPRRSCRAPVGAHESP